MLSFNCSEKKSWEISNNGHIKKGDEQIMPHTLRNGILYMPTDTVRCGYLSLTDCFNRTQKLWFAPEELPKVKAALNILKESAPDLDEIETVDIDEDAEYREDEGASDIKESASVRGSREKEKGRAEPFSINFKKSIPEAEKLRKNGEMLETIGKSVYTYGVALAVIALLASVILGFYCWIQWGEFSTCGISILSGAGAFLVIYVTAWWNRLMLNCIASFLIGQSCIVQGTTVTARTNLYIADKLVEQSENQNS